MPFAEVSPPPTTATVGAGGAKGPPVDSYSATIPGAGGVPLQQANLGIENANAGELTNTVAAGKVGVDTAANVQKGAEALIPAATDYSAKVKAIEDEYPAKIKRAGDEYDRAMQEASDRKYENHWADQSTGTKVLAAISSFLGGLATGTPVNRAQEWIDRDYQMQKEQADHLLKVAEMKGASRQHLVELQGALMKNLAAGYEGKIEAVKRQVDAKAAALGTEQARVNADKLKSDLELAQAKERQESAKSIQIQVIAHTSKEKARLLKDVPKATLPDGTKLWRDPLTGTWKPFAKPIQAPSVATPPATASAQPAVAVAPAAPGLAGLDVNAAANNLAAVGR